MADTFSEFVGTFKSIIPSNMPGATEALAEIEKGMVANKDKVIAGCVQTVDLAYSKAPAPTRAAHAIGKSTFGSYATAGVVGLVLTVTGVQVGSWIGKGIGMLRGTV